MIYSPGRNYLFIHIPKTGGTSLALALEARAMKDDILVGDTPKARKRQARQKKITCAGRLWKHATLADLDGLVSPEAAEGLFVFTIVRNPWDRMVSFYHWLRVQTFSHPSVTLARSLEFSAFLNHPVIGNLIRQNDYARYLRTADGREICSAWLRMETLAADVENLSGQIGCALGPLEHANRSKRNRDYRLYYCDADAERLGDIAETDITRFGYSF